MKFLRARARIGRRKLRSAAGVTVTPWASLDGCHVGPGGHGERPGNEACRIRPGNPEKRIPSGPDAGVPRALHFDVPLSLS